MKGIYILLIKIKSPIKLNIGKLGKIIFTKGNYAYVGSAQNNLEKRIKRHISKNKKIHWHIDYILKNREVRIIKVFYKIARKEQECMTARKLIKNNESIQRFGSSDCKCKSHLIKTKKTISIKNFRSFTQN